MTHPYLICASPRTGSNLLATALRGTGIAGWPFEYFNMETMNQAFMLKALGIADAARSPDFRNRLPRIVDAGTTANGVFGATVHWIDLRNLMAAIGSPLDKPAVPDSSVRGLVETAWPGIRYIWLSRRNKVAQAVSRYLARTTGRYQIRDRPGEAPECPVDVPFDFAMIDRFVDMSEHEERGWAGFLPADATLLHLTYEEIDADYEAAVAAVLEFIDVGASGVAIPPPAFKRQADERNAAWEVRYRAEKRAI